MLIDDENIRVQYDSTAESPIMAGDALPFPFRFIEKDQVKAILLDGTKLVFNEDYTVGLEEDEEEKPEGEDEASVSSDYTSVILNIDIPVGETITLYRETDLDQTSEFPQEARFSSRKIEDALDKLTMQNQEQREALGRAIKLPLTAAVDLKDLALPNPEPNKSVKWNSEGTALVNTSFDPDTALVTTENFKKQAEQSAKDSANSASASANSATVAGQKVNEITALHSDKVNELTALHSDYMDDINTTSTNYLNQINSRGNTIIKDADAIINRVGLNMFDTVIKDHILTYEESKGLALQGTYVYKEAITGSRYGYPDFYNKCLEEYNEATSTETVNGVTVKVHSNGHKFYNISDKTAIDSFFNTMGSAWMYGVDTENERIFLPRNNWFEQITIYNSRVGESVQAGLPNITATVTRDISEASATGAISITSSYNGAMWQGATNVNRMRDWNFDASRSSAVYGNSNTVQPISVKKLLYICVGNKITDTAHIDIVAQVNNGVKEIEDKKNECLVDIENNKDIVISELHAVSATEQAELEEIRDDVINYAGIYYEEILDDDLQIQVVGADCVSKEELEEGLATKQPVGDYVTNTELEEGLATKQPVGDYVTNTELNDKGYLTSYTETDPIYTKDKPTLALKSELPDITPLATKTEVEEGLNTKQNKGNYALKSELPTVPTLVSELENDSNYATQTQVLQAIASIPQFSLSIVEALPTTGEKMILYLVPKEETKYDGTKIDVYYEYIWIEQTASYEFLGTTAPDLTDYVKNTDYANSSTGGVFKTYSGLYATAMNSDGYLYCQSKTLDSYKNDNSHMFICKGTLENVKNDLVKRAVTENDIELTADEQTNARTWLGAVGKEDYSTSATAGLVRCANTYGMNIAERGLIQAVNANLDTYNARGNAFFIGKGTLEKIKDDYVKRGITANNIELTADEKTNARTWLGAVGKSEYPTSSKAGVVAISSTYGTGIIERFLCAAVHSLSSYKNTLVANGIIGKGTLENVLAQYSKTVLTTEADYNALETKDANTLYLIEE